MGIFHDNLSLSDTAPTNPQQLCVKSHEHIVREIKIFQPWQDLHHPALQTDQIVEGEIEGFEAGLVGEHVGLEGYDVHAGQGKGF